MENASLIIVIGRQFGAGGRAVGRLLANRFGIAYYDKELLSEASSEFGLAPELFAKADERKPSVLQGVLSLCYGVTENPCSGTMTGPDLYAAQSRVIEGVASKGPCVIVGRTADYVLRHRPGLVSIFLHAPEQWRSERIVARGEADNTAKALDKARRNDRCREEYYNYFTGRRWGTAGNYDLTVDCSAAGPEGTAEVVAAFVKAKLGLGDAER